MPQTSPPDIGQKIKQLRSAKNLTLDQLAVKSGVSKSMLSQIERNKTNPTVATLWSLTRALGIDIGEILGGNNQVKEVTSNIALIKSHQTPEIQSADGKCTLRILGPLSMVSHIEWYDVNLEQDGLLASEPHVDGTTEHLTVLKGEISISSGAEKQILSRGDTARYNGDVEHSIKNIGSSNAHAILMVYSPE
ncbi:MAG: helix-turn-helix transcriptional regulator [Kordiimonadaceae bacterium]|jgi:XRE family transcriptional regulator, regulator of sulfur utilization|nr:helix-turn-helix transcriptional regulator [Kordiimonadaceae bacterium]MBT6034970.1 helix-turn-helix transcriptional regulator [Kordiimonadaceae bacterium]MBT6329185.1 helix-turn-helix transcriptional regulator [Kordiimonadaceae bacterium]MBT7581999.1 helix-turn-helix transcriptional regulator [Kordiimonadaceae bacterium]